MEKRYDPRGVERKWYEYWLEKSIFTPSKREGRPFVIVMPPPNVTGPLTMGHVLNLSLQDVLIRWNMVNGRECLWLPGKDHAGIATQNAVEKELLTQGLTRHDLGREEFTRRVWEWKEEMSEKISQQIRDLGCACDWTRERFTMDGGLSKAVRKAFVTLFKDGLIYRGQRVINWCPRCRTALADEEVEREEVQAKLYYIKYPLEKGGHIVVATTRPETMLGDVAVAVSPGDDRYKSLIGSVAILPFIRRRMPIIEDEFVDPEFGTGAVKVTPAHDADDFEIGNRHGLEPVVVMDEDGKMNENAGSFKGLNRFECRKRLIEELSRDGLLEKITDYTYSLGKCYRCSTIVEPYLSKQFFVKMKPLAQPAIEVVRNGRIKFHPERWAKVYFNWMEGIRDWCISRQIWWGHRIPVWYCESCGAMISEFTDPTSCLKCGGRLRQEEDVLDTWFSSWLWPFSTLGWPDRTEDLARYYPTSVLVTGPDIIFFWVARMIMAGLYFMKDVPFTDVFLHGLIRDEFGRKMSKSLGNSPDPSELISKYGADALRFTMVSLTPRGSDVLFAERNIETGRNFANKVWNAARLIASVKTEEEIDSLKLELSDRWILSRTARIRSEFETRISAFELNEGAKAIYDFFWHTYCDWYLELIKTRLYSDNVLERTSAITIARIVMRESLKLLHPFMPFLTEEVWRGLSLGDGSLLEDESGLPEIIKIDPEAEQTMERIIGIIETVRTIRGAMNVHPSRSVPLYLNFGEGKEAEEVMTWIEYVKKMARVSEIKLGKPGKDEHPFGSGVVGEIEIALPLGDLIDVEVERARLKKELDRIDALIERCKRKLDDPDFQSRAPQHVVAKQKEKLEALLASRAKIERNLSMIID